MRRIIINLGIIVLVMLNAYIFYSGYAHFNHLQNEGLADNPKLFPTIMTKSKDLINVSFLISIGLVVFYLFSRQKVDTK